VEQQLCDLAVLLRGQAGQHIFEIGIRVMPVEPGAVDQAHDGSGALAGAQGANKQPVASPNGDRADPVLDVVVVHGQASIAGETCQRRPAFQTVVQCLGLGRAVCDFSASLLGLENALAARVQATSDSKQQDN